VTRLAPGDKAPSFTLKDQNGEKVSLKEYLGSRLVLYFYPADDTPGCTKEACQFNDELSQFTQLGTLVFGISPDGAQKHQAFIKKFRLNFSLLSDPDTTTMEKYGAYGEKMMYGKKVTGVIRSTFIVDTKGKIERAFYNVRADGHAAKVLAALS
jgi:thioredoxin-dependent peroxiredoxin